MYLHFCGEIEVKQMLLFFLFLEVEIIQYDNFILYITLQVVVGYAEETYKLSV